MIKRTKLKKYVIYLCLISIGYMFLLGLSQHIRVNQMVKAFINRSEEGQWMEVYFPDGLTERRMYHAVQRKSDFELQDERSVFFETERNPYLGQKGDIFVTQESPFPDIFGVHQLMTFFVGGHAALNNGNNQFIEAVGFPQSGERIWDIIKDPSNGTHDFSVGVRQSTSNYWMLPNYRNDQSTSYPFYGSYYREKFLVLRVKQTDTIVTDRALDYATFHLNNRSLYNFLFFTDTNNKFYCTDLISRSYRYAMNTYDKDKGFPRTLNDNGFVTTVNDLILSKDTYLAVYVENKDGIRHIYYLDDLY